MVVTATAQRKGRGRLGRSWSSPPGNLYCSLLLRPARAPCELPTLSLVISLALAEAIGERARLKWPNDVLVDGAKVAGILLEGQDDTVIVGMGVNIVHAPADTPYPAKSLRDLGLEISSEELLTRFIKGLAGLYALWNEKGFEALRQRWLLHAEGIGAIVRVRQGEKISHGRLLALDGDGSIVVASEQGGVNRHSAGELILSQRPGATSR